MRDKMNISAETAREAERRFLLAFDRLDEALERGTFLVGNHFSRADLAACALLGPLCRPGESESEVEALLPSTVCALRKQLQHRRFYQWVLQRYRSIEFRSGTNCNTRKVAVDVRIDPFNVLGVALAEMDVGECPLLAQQRL
jgi:Glutathione S-transferase, C-terminal domain